MVYCVHRLSQKCRERMNQSGVCVIRENKRIYS